MKRRHSVGVGGFGLQHGRTHVAAEQELDHLKLDLLTPTRPNSQARSNGVLPAESEMHGLDWCCSNISDSSQDPLVLMPAMSRIAALNREAPPGLAGVMES
ncbi:hypothetical protein EYF80_003900 [Liparis tanakae]|uniref:Uncharacterized protein n=1 Tax=Liparis tanakae TaxID=230148 RepID=A0A4Z2J784_9TELE|nr:hypothetical protein EYF80_003900 [Liparis tanakae]